MRFKQAKPRPILKQKYRSYSPTALTNAYKQVKENGMSVKRASLTYGVPDTTLRDRVLNKVDPETAVFGKAPLLEQFEEAKLVDHIKMMSSYGFGYTRQECIDIASDFAVQLGKRRLDQPLTMKWMRGFLKRWPELRVLKPRGLEHARAKMASETTVSDYFDNLEATIKDLGLTKKPHLIFNVDEKGVTIDHKPPHVVASATHCPSAVTSGRGQTITILGCGSASGVAIPPFFIFPGKKMMPELMKGASAGAAGTVSDSGWSNGSVFRHYLEHHFLQHAPGRGQKVLLILDGHKSHVSVGLSEWAQQNDIILFVLPAHTSHILQPMDVSCYGPFQRIYNNSCHKFIRESAATITRYNICKLACQAYTKALSPENIKSGFERTGIHPFNKDAVPQEHLIPAQVYKASEAENITPTSPAMDPVTQEESAADEDVEPEQHVDLPEGESAHGQVFEMFTKKENQLREIKSGQIKKPRNTMSKLVSGKALTNDVLIKMKEHVESSVKILASKKCDQKENVKKTKSKKQKHAQTKVVAEPQPGPSHYNLATSASDASQSDSGTEDTEVCCCCNRFQPKELVGSASLIFTKWVQCDGRKSGQPCLHWVHLGYCTPGLRVIRKGDSFFCNHCRQEE